MTDDIKTQLEQLVAGEWRERDDTWSVDLPARGWRVVVDWRRNTGMRPAVWEAMLWAPDEVLRYATVSGDGAGPVSALSALCCQPLAVSILHGLGAFPEVDEPDPAWPWWWMWYGKPDGDEELMHVVLVEDVPRFWHRAMEFWETVESVGKGGWRRAPAPPGWQP